MIGRLDFLEINPKAVNGLAAEFEAWRRTLRLRRIATR